jgi:hypothetical protein
VDDTLGRRYGLTSSSTPERSISPIPTASIFPSLHISKSLHRIVTFGRAALGWDIDARYLGKEMDLRIVLAIEVLR